MTNCHLQPTLRDRILHLFGPVPIASLVVYRIAFGLVMVWYAVKSWDSVLYFYVRPLFHFSYTGFHWVQPVDWRVVTGSGEAIHGMHMVFATLCVSSLLIAIGWFYRFAAIVFAITFTYIFLCDKTYYQNHYYLVSILGVLMPFLPLHRSFSIDAWRRPELRSSTIPRWVLWLMRFQIGVPYLFGGIAKLNLDWLRGQPMRMNVSSPTSDWLLAPWIYGEPAVQLFTWGGLLFDLLVVPALLWRRTRVLAYLLCIGFHVMNAVTWTIGIFPWLMILATTIYFNPDWPTRMFASFRSRAILPAQNQQPVTVNRLTPRRKIVAAVLGIYVSLQCLVPLRHLVLPGNPSWTEYDHYFSWHMMLRAKQQAIALYVTEPETGRSGMVDVQDFVTFRQLAVVSRDPQLIHQLCHHVHNGLASIGHPDLEVRALVLASLNGRKAQLLVDPHVDLAAEPISWRYPEWIVPLREPYRHDAWGVPLSQWRAQINLDLPASMEQTGEPVLEIRPTAN